MALRYGDALDRIRVRLPRIRKMKD